MASVNGDGEESLSHSIAPKLSQRGIFTLSPPGKFKHRTMVRLKASKPRIRVLCIASGERHLLPESSPEHLSSMPTFKKCELLSKATVFPAQWHIGRHLYFAHYYKRSLRASLWGPSVRPMKVSTKRTHCSPWVPEMKCPSGSSLHGNSKWKT